MTQLSRRTATTRFSPEGCQKQTAPRCCQHPTRWTFYLASIHQMAPPGTHPENRPTPHLSTRRDERLSWPIWLTCSGRFTHIEVTRRLQASAGQGQFAGQRPAFRQLCYATNQLKRNRLQRLCLFRLVRLHVFVVICMLFNPTTVMFSSLPLSDGNAAD